MNKPRLVRTAFASTCIAVALFLLASLVGALRQALDNTKGAPGAEWSATPSDVGFEYREVVFAANDDRELSGWWLPSRNGAAVIFTHGLGQTRADMLARAAVLIEAGYGALLFDLQAHGLSDGERFPTSWGAYEDVEAALSFVLAQPDVDPARVGAFGFSVGASATVRALHDSELIRGLFLDGMSAASFSDEPWPRTLVEAALQPGMFFYPWMLAAVVSKREPRPQIEMLEEMRVPVYFVSAGDGLEARRVARYASRARSARGLLNIAEATHGGGMSARPGAYGAALGAFFDEVLAEPVATSDTVTIAVP